MQNSILNPKVLVRCMTYNHEKYIEDALNGFIIQKTDFPFTVAIVDDASTDNNVTVIKEFISKNFNRTKNYIEEDKEYGKVIQSQATNNPNCHFYVILLNKNHYSDPNKRALRHFYYRFIEDQAKYIAMCEGDDYWTDPYKLQKQVDYMESHPECSMCFHGVQILDELSHELQPDFLEDVPYSKDGLRLAQGNYIHSVSVMFRKNGSVDEKYAKVGRISMGDQILYHLYAEVGHFKKLPDIMGVYRVGNGQWSAASDAYRHLMSVISLSKTVPLLQNSEVRKQLDETIYQYANVVFNIINEKDKEILSIHNSRAYRIGTFLLKPARFLKKCTKKLKKLIKKIIS